MLALVLAALLAVPPDTTAAPPDSLAASPDSLAASPDSLAASPDSLAAGETTAGEERAVDAAGGVQDDPRDRVRVRPRLAPSALYSETRGFGIGGGIGVTNLLWRGSEATLDLRLQQRAQGVALTVYTGDPYDSSVYGTFSGVASTTQRRRYFGVGPFSDGDDAFFLDHNAASAEARLGLYPLGHTGLIVQPSARLLYDRFLGISDASPEQTPAAVLDPASVAALGTEDEHRYGLSLGLEVGSDLRDWRAYPRRGTFATLEGRRFVALDGSDLRFTRVAVATIGYLPIRGRTALIGRFDLVVTRSDDADGDGTGDAIPFYYLPTLDDRLAAPFSADRLIGRDVAVGALGVRLPVVDFLGVYGIDALVMGYLGNVYDDVFEQFRPTVAFESTLAPGSEAGAALRPALGLGIGLVNLDKERVVIGGLLGIGSGGIRLATLRVAYDLRDARPLFR